MVGDLKINPFIYRGARMPVGVPYTLTILFARRGLGTKLIKLIEFRRKLMLYYIMTSVLIHGYSIMTRIF